MNDMCGDHVECHDDASAICSIHGGKVTGHDGEVHHFEPLDPQATVRPTCELADQCWVQTGEQQGQGHGALATMRISSENMPDEMMCAADAISTADSLVCTYGARK